MTIEHWLRELRDAFLRNNYERQTEIARYLLPYEKSGVITNALVMEVVS